MRGTPNEPRGGTMAMTMKDFLLRYFRQLHFDTMPDPVRRRFDSYVDKNDFIGNMKSWRDDLLKKDPVSGNLLKDSDGHYVHNDVPGKDDMDEESWTRLYELLQSVFTRLNDNRDSLDKETVKFLNKYFGNQNNIFSPAPLSNETKSAVANLFTAFKTLDEDKAFALFGKYCSKDGEPPSKWDFQEFKNAIESGSYATDSGIRKTLRKFILGLDRDYEDTAYTVYGAADPLAARKAAFKEKTGLDIDPNSFSDTLNTIYSGLEPTKEITQTDVEKLFKETENGKSTNIRDILKAIHDNEKIAADVGKYDNGKITGQLDKALEKTDYTGKRNEKDYVPEKYDDHLNIFEQAKKDVKDWVDDKLGFFKDFHREHIYHNKEAETIMGAILAAGISPTSGLGAIIEKKEDIKKNLAGKQPLHSIEYFNWMLDEWERLKNGGVKNAFNNATKEPGKMRTLAENLGKNSADKMTSLDASKRKELKTKTTVAMELMEVMEYGTFQGKTVQAINGTEVSIFSDKNLSFNKNNPAIASITSAVDATLKKTIQLAGYVGTGVVNKIRQSSAKMNHSGILETEHQKWMAENKKNKDSFETSKDEQDAADNAEIANYQGIMAGTNITDINAEEAQLETLRNNETAANEALNRAKEKVQTLQAQEDSHQRFEKQLAAAEKQVEAARKEVEKAKAKLKVLEEQEKDYKEYEKLTDKLGRKGKALYGLQMKASTVDEENAEKTNQAFEKKTEERNQIQEQINALLRKYSPKGKPVTDEALINLHKNYQANKKLADRAITIAEKTLQNKTNEFQELQSHRGEHPGCAAQLEQAKTEAETAQQSYDSAHTTVESKAQDIATFKDAQSQIEFYNKQIADRQETFDKWDDENVDYYDFFMGYWDFLHTGNTKRLFKFSRKQVQQQAYSGQMEQNLQAYMQANQYSYVA